MNFKSFFTENLMNNGFELYFDLDNTLLMTTNKVNELQSPQVLIINQQTYYTQLRPKTIATLSNLTAQGYKLFVLTAGPKFIQEEIIKKHNIKSFFDAVYYKEDLNKFLPYSPRRILIDNKDITDNDIKAKLKFLHVTKKGNEINNNSSHFIQLPAWSGNQNDTELTNLDEMLSPVVFELKSVTP